MAINIIGVNYFNIIMNKCLNYLFIISEILVCKIYVVKLVIFLT